jgi:hypothetical protein
LQIHRRGAPKSMNVGKLRCRVARRVILIAPQIVEVPERLAGRSI